MLRLALMYPSGLVSWGRFSGGGFDAAARRTPAESSLRFFLVSFGPAATLTLNVGVPGLPDAGGWSTLRKAAQGLSVEGIAAQCKDVAFRFAGNEEQQRFVIAVLALDVFSREWLRVRQRRV